MFFWFYIYEKPVTKKLIVFEQTGINKALSLIGLITRKGNIQWI